MYNESNRRHYRVAQKEITTSPTKGVFIPNEKKQYYILFAIGMFVVTFIQGFVMGYLVSKDK